MTNAVKLVVAVVLQDDQKRILLARRPEGKSMTGLWEFPGGKVGPGEVPEAALVRELDEELGIGVEVFDLRPLTFASHGYADFHLLMPLYSCVRWKGDPKPLEHSALAWVHCDELRGYEMPPADEPLIPLLKALL
jgi:8-oxo-dGTP diphosphatase